MRVLICPTAFKGSLTASEAARAMREGAARALPDAGFRILPLSDGGPGLIEALARSGAGADGPDAGSGGGSGSRARIERVEGVAAPVPPGTEDGGRTVEGRVLLTDDGRTAVVESADACGLALLSPAERDPLRTHTRGVGDLLRAALGRDPETVVVGLGGSATCDGGVGALRRFGYRFLDGAGRAVPDGGGALPELAEVRPPGGRSGRGVRAGRDQGDATTELVALADVDNPLLGPDGAARTYAPQKGADEEGVRRLEEGLRRLVEVAARDLGDGARRVRAAAERPGAGAAGGLAFGLDAMLGARVVGGTEWVLRRVGFDDALAGADLVVTGEGAYDRTSGRGKVVGEVIRRARRAGVPVRLVCGRIEGDLPPDVRGEDGGGRFLDAAGLADAAARAAGRGTNGPPSAAD